MVSAVRRANRADDGVLPFRNLHDRANVEDVALAHLGAGWRGHVGWITGDCRDLMLPIKRLLEDSLAEHTVRAVEHNPHISCSQQMT